MFKCNLLYLIIGISIWIPFSTIWVFNYVVEEQETCTSQACLEAGNRIYGNLNESVNPCDDFYTFACGNFIRKQKIKDYKSDVSQFSIAGDDLNSELFDILDNINDNSDQKHVKLLSHLYQSCMDTDSELMRLIKYLGGWPVLMKSYNGHEWFKVLARLGQKGYTKYLWEFSVDADIKNMSRYVIYLSDSSLGMEQREFYLKKQQKKVLFAYLEMMIESAVALGADEEQSRSDMTEVLRFESALAEMTLPSEISRNIASLYRRTRMKDVKFISPNIPWDDYFKLFFNIIELDNYEIVLLHSDFFKKLNTLIEVVENRVIVNYLIWRFVYENIALLGNKWRKISGKFKRVSSGETMEAPRKEQCLKILRDNLSLTLDALYISSKTKDAIHQVELKLKLNNCLSKQTQRKALRKLQAMKNIIGYPSEMKNLTALNNYYKNVKSQGFEEQLHCCTFLAAFGGNWVDVGNAAVINAFYNPPHNSLIIAMGILRQPFFDYNLPMYYNFGGIGYIIGHEFMHGFDDNGRLYDADGNSRNWWDKETDRKFRDRAKCLVKQYSNYYLPDLKMHLNGNLTIGENIADNSGISVAYMAYKKYVKDHKKEASFPNMKYTPEQLFWISAAQVWCNKEKPEYTRKLIISDVHSPGKFRIIGSFSNEKHFAKDFNCEPGSTMNPKQRCAVW